MVFPLAAETKQVLKVDFKGDVRRLTLELAAGTSAADAFQIVCDTVASGFGLNDQAIQLKYIDDEGDTCTLLGSTFEDFAQLAGSSVWRLTADVLSRQPDSQSDVQMTDPEAQAASAAPEPVRNASAPPAPGDASGQPGGPGAEPPPGAAAEDPSASASSGGWRGVAGDAAKSAWETSQAEAFSHFALHLLPFVSAAAQSDSARAKLSAAGLEHREQFLPHFKRIAENLNTVPEAAPLAPALHAYLENLDPNHLGDFIADLLRAWATSHAHEAVRETLKANRDVLQAVAARVFEGAGFQDVLGHLQQAAPSGMPFAPPARGSEGPAGEHSEVPASGAAGSAGGAGATHAGTGAPFGMPSFGAPGGMSPGGIPPVLGGLLGALLSQANFQGGATVNSTSSSSSSASHAAHTATSTAAAGTADFDRKVGELLEMGLVTDPSLARELLEANDADVAKVVAMLTA